jgi:uncharacterized DUF497 family protein
MKADLSQFDGFQWDEGNRGKNWAKHRVTEAECDEVFFNAPLVVLDDPKHSRQERRYAAFGKTDRGRRLAVVFTRRGNLLRIISARDMSRKELEFYGTYR